MSHPSMKFCGNQFLSNPAEKQTNKWTGGTKTFKLFWMNCDYKQVSWIKSSEAEYCLISPPSVTQLSWVWERRCCSTDRRHRGAGRPGVSFITVAYAQNEAWNVRTPLLTQTLAFIKTNLTGKFAYFHANSDPCVRTFGRRESGEADVRWWTEARLLIHFIIYIITNSLVLLARHICLKIYKTTYSKWRLDSIEQRSYGSESWLGFNNIF